uniref:ubiquitinyl hydrolase 1 n=1 Tax=Oryzias melastigma TaxID=30732 RepID=A0A3B3CSZ7_ORYME
MDSIFHEKQPSGNMDDSGFFSIQVISNALRVWGLELILFNSREYQIDLTLTFKPNLMSSHFRNEKAFICNYKEHWFTIRKLGQQVCHFFLRLNRCVYA